MLKKFNIKYDKDNFWNEYWKTFKVDPKEFKQLDIYPIKMALKYTNKKDKILECGFGGGRVISHLSYSGFTNVIGVENDEQIVRLVAQTYPNLDVRIGNILDLQFGDSTFDTVLCFGVIGGLEEEISKAITELKRVLKPNGILVVSAISDNFARKIQRYISRFNSLDTNFYSWYGTPQEWINYFESEGLKLIEYDLAVSRYSIFYWAPFFRSYFANTNLSKARVDEREFKLNPFGEILWLMHKYMFRRQLAMGATYVLKRNVVI